MTIKTTPPYKVHSLERGLDIMELLVTGKAELSLKELASEAGFSASTAHRILGALKARGYVVQDPATARYRLSFKLFEMGSMIIRRVSLRDEARPVLRELAAVTGESAHLNIVDKDECLCLEKIEGSHAMKVTFLQIGGRIALHLGAGPKVLLAYLPNAEIDRIIGKGPLFLATARTITDPSRLREEIRLIRERGYALSFGERTDGAGSIGFPVRDHLGDVIAGISITGYAAHFDEQHLPVLIEHVGRAAALISKRLNAPVPPG